MPAHSGGMAVNMSKDRRRRSGDSSADTSGDWMNTYADMVTLLLTFFIMLFSMANIDKQKFNQIANSLRIAFMHQGGGGEIFESNGGSQVIDIYDDLNAVDKVVSLVNDELDGEEYDENGKSTAEDMGKYQVEDLREEIEEAIKEMDLEDNVQIVERTDFLLLRFDSVILFDLGSAEIRDSALDILEKIGLMLNKLDNEIIIQGHTDDLPINTQQFPSNWELSTRRATNVIHFFIDYCKIDPSRLTATGNAEFKPVKPNNNGENRQQNRRIDIVVSKSE